MKALLKVHGYEAYTVYDGSRALAATVAIQPDVVILEVQMPGLSGLEVCRAIRRHEWGKAILMVAQTGWARDEDARLAKEAGFDLHMSKPLKIEDLLRVLEGVGQRHSPESRRA